MLVSHHNSTLRHNPEGMDLKHDAVLQITDEQSAGVGRNSRSGSSIEVPHEWISH